MPPRKRSPEQIVRELKRLQETALPDRDQRVLLHEVSVYQEEIVVQNEALTDAQSALEETRNRFVELFDFAPNGYLVLDQTGIVRECNLTAATLIGFPKQAIEGHPMLPFVWSDDRAQYLDFLRRCRRAANNTGVEGEFTIRAAQGPRHMQLFCRPRHNHGSGTREYLTSLVDVTDRKHLETERAQIAREHAVLAGRLISIQDEERQRIARNLHDDLGQQVTALKLKLEELAMETSDEAPRGTAIRAQQMVEQLDRRLHFVATALRPPALDLGVVAAIEHFVHQWSNTFGIRASFRTVGVESTGLTPAADTQLYRIAQEALNNVAKHARAHLVVMSLECRSGALMMRIEDDGCGFDAAVSRSDVRGLGLIGMRERTQLIGGGFDINTSPGRGTSVVVTVPLDRSTPRC